MAAQVSKTHTFLHFRDRAVSVPNSAWSTVTNDGANGVVVRETNYPVDGVEYVEVDGEGALWFIRTALYETGRLSETARRDYEWERDERVEANLRHQRAA